MRIRLLPRINYTNFRKEFPNMGPGTFNDWFYFQRYWSGRIINIGIKHHQISLDFRYNFLNDMVGKELFKGKL